MTDQHDRNEPRHDAAAATDDTRDEEAVRRLARHFLVTPPQPRKAALKGEPKPKGRRKPQER